MKLIQEPSNLAWKHRYDGVVSQLASILVLAQSVVEGNVSSMLASASHQGVYNVAVHLQLLFIMNSTQIM